ncbi:MAG: hypothetical protein HY235_07760 [Acidobacteria bacterium]|nr:hypothetical protein [Acidobacteriota bacterium]
MDLLKAIRELYEEKKRLDDAIEQLEGLSRPGRVEELRRRRGRRSMDAEERAAVSRRMREYWAKRRKVMKAGQAG